MGKATAQDRLCAAGHGARCSLACSSLLLLVWGATGLGNDTLDLEVDLMAGSHRPSLRLSGLVQCTAAVLCSYGQPLVPGSFPQAWARL